MALVVQTLETAILRAFNNVSNVEVSPEELRRQMARELAQAIDAYIRTATVNPGIPVSTAGTAAAQTGTTTGPGTLS